jgi:acyl-CoA-binding protein
LLNNFNEAAKEINSTAERINNSWLLNLFGSRTKDDTNTGRKLETC